MDAVNKLTELVRDTETHLLKAFHHYAEVNDKRNELRDMRLKAAEITDANVISRLSLIEDRVLEIEKRLNLPPGK